MASPFDAVVFAGGGSRCFWQLGFWSVAGPALELAPRVVSAVSAGSAMAVAALLGRCESVLQQFKAATARNPQNAYPQNLLRGRPVFPHYRMYRAALLEAVSEEDLRRLQQAVDLRVVVGRSPRWIGGRTALLFGLGVYLVERRFGGDPVHSRLARRVGFSAAVVGVRACRDTAELADLCIASSCTPPFTPALRWDGVPAVDGGLLDSAPVFALDGDEQRALVLLTRRYGNTPAPTDRRIYVGPSEPVPISKWDYTSPEGLQQAYDLGRRDAEAFIRDRARR